MSSATDSASRVSVFGSRTANSSPPSRATTASGGTAAATRSATWTSTRSPTRCPKLSLMSLKASRSSISTPGRPASFSSSCSSSRVSAARLAVPVSASVSAIRSISRWAARSSAVRASTRCSKSWYTAFSSPARRLMPVITASTWSRAAERGIGVARSPDAIRTMPSTTWVRRASSARAGDGDEPPAPAAPLWWPSVTPSVPPASRGLCLPMKSIAWGTADGRRRRAGTWRSPCPRGRHRGRRRRPAPVRNRTRHAPPG